MINALLSLTVGDLPMFRLMAFVDEKLEKKSPSTVILATTTTLLALSVLARCFQEDWGKTRREQVGDVALKIPFVKKKYAEDIEKQLLHFQASLLKKWGSFGEPLTTIPEKGWSTSALVKLLELYSKVTAEALQGKHVSGTIYSKSLDCGYRPIQLEVLEEEREIFASDAHYFDHLSQKLKKIFTLGFEQSYLWNSLHSDEFPIGSFIDYQVVRMVASNFGGAPNEVMGFVTSGGTESLMLAIRAYRNWGFENRRHQPGEGVVIAAKSVHAAILKAGIAYCVKVELVETDKDGKVDIQKLSEAVKKHGDKVIAIVGSAPSYPKGVVDPIEEMAKIAQQSGCGLHVDACLGGFIIEHLKKHKTDYLKIPGVTSLSADVHKNGQGPKGVSVLVTKQLNASPTIEPSSNTALPLNLAVYSIYALPDWEGGVYGSPKDAGSQSCDKSLQALLALLGTGVDGYQRIANAVYETTCSLASLIGEFSGKLKVVAEPEVNVVAFQVDESWGLQKGATYAFAHEMAKRKFVLNVLSQDIVHFCVTLRFASDPKGLGQFRKMVEECLTATEKLNAKLIEKGEKFSGDAGMYCAIEAAITPDRKALSLSKYVQNLLLGRQGAKDAVRAYFLAQLNPFKKEEEWQRMD